MGKLTILDYLRSWFFRLTHSMALYSANLQGTRPGVFFGAVILWALSGYALALTTLAHPPKVWLVLAYGCCIAANFGGGLIIALTLIGTLSYMRSLQVQVRILKDSQPDDATTAWSGIQWTPGSLPAGHPFVSKTILTSTPRRWFGK